MATGSDTQIITAAMNDVMNQDGWAYDQIFGRIAILLYLMIQDGKPSEKIRVNKRVMESDGGAEIEVSLQYAKTGTSTNITGLETIGYVKKDFLTTAKYDWGWMFTTGILDNKDILKCEGKASKLTSLTDSFLYNLAMTMAEDVSTQIMAASPGTKDFHSIPYLIPDDPTAASTIGGIAQASYSWWQNNYKDSAAGSVSGMLAEIANLRNTISLNRKGDTPDLCMTDQTQYEQIENYYISKGTHTFQNSELENLMGTGQVGKVKGMNLIWDNAVPESTASSKSRMYLLNTKYIGFRVHKGRKFELSEPMNMKVATQQDATGWDIGLGGQLVCSNRKKQGVLFDISQALTM